MIQVKKLVVFDDGTHKWVVIEETYDHIDSVKNKVGYFSAHFDSAYGVFINNKLEWLYLSGLGFKVSAE